MIQTMTHRCLAFGNRFKQFDSNDWKLFLQKKKIKTAIIFKQVKKIVRFLVPVDGTYGLDISLKCIELF